jgi:hypothetical protein
MYTKKLPSFILFLFLPCDATLHLSFLILEKLSHNDILGGCIRADLVADLELLRAGFMAHLGMFER